MLIVRPLTLAAAYPGTGITPFSYRPLARNPEPAFRPHLQRRPPFVPNQSKSLTLFWLPARLTAHAHPLPALSTHSHDSPTARLGDPSKPSAETSRPQVARQPATSRRLRSPPLRNCEPTWQPTPPSPTPPSHQERDRCLARNPRSMEPIPRIFPLGIRRLRDWNARLRVVLNGRLFIVKSRLGIWEIQGRLGMVSFRMSEDSPRPPLAAHDSTSRIPPAPQASESPPNRIPKTSGARLDPPRPAVS